MHTNPSKQNASDQELLIAWQRGDEAAGSALISRHRPKLSRYFRRRESPDAADDLTQRTLLRCVESRHRVLPGLRFDAYLMGIAKNLLKMYRRSLSRRHSIRDRFADAAPPRGWPVTPDIALFRNESRRHVHRATVHLSSAHNQVIQLFYWYDKTIDEIAHELDIAPGTVKSRLARARSSMRTILGTDPALNREPPGQPGQKTAARGYPSTPPSTTEYQQ